MQDKRWTLRDMAAGLLVVLALALPFVRLPGDSAARMKVHFRSDNGETPRVLSTETSAASAPSWRRRSPMTIRTPAPSPR